MGDRLAAGPVLDAAAWQIEFRLPRPAWSPGEQFHWAVIECLEKWQRLQRWLRQSR